MKPLALILPFPPSVNTYWRSMRKGPLAGRVIISKRGREYRKEVVKMVPEQMRGHAKILGPVMVHLIENPPDRRIRDLDNYLKALFDSCKHADVFGDDSQIKRITHEWYGLHLLYKNVAASPYVLDPGMLALEITNLETL